ADEQREGWEATKKRVLTKVAEWKPGRSQKSVMRRLVQLVPRPFHGVFEYGVEKELMARKDGVMVPRFRPYCRVPTEVEERLRASWGKTAIITDLAEAAATDPELVRGWVLRTEIEDEFKWLKDRQVISAKPFWVWHDAAVPGHIFLCVMGLLLLRYLQREVRDLGLSVKQLVETLEGIRVGVVSRGGKPGAGGQPEVVVERMNRLQAELASRLKLLEFLPKVEPAD
ncbi:transposase-like protein, partial [mine drainage metagenome]